MGLLDFGDRATIQLQAYRIGCAVLDMEKEIKKSPNTATPDLRGLASFIGQEMNKLLILFRSLSQSSQDSLKVEFKGEKMKFWAYYTALVPTCNKVRDLTGIDFLENTMLTKDGIRRKINFR